MTFIDWSDPEEMVSLLVEYVEDELAASDDRARREFLTDLREALDGVASDLPASLLSAAIAALRAIYEEQPAEFASDPVLVHVDACIEELTRIARDSPEK